MLLLTAHTTAQWWGHLVPAQAPTGMLGSRLLGVYSAAKGTTHLVASSLLFGHMLKVSRTPSVSSGWFQSAAPSIVLLLFQARTTVPPSAWLLRCLLKATQSSSRRKRQLR